MAGEGGAAPRKKAADIRVLRCLAPECRGMLAYEVTGDNILYVDLAWTARVDGEKRYFPCPKCGGRNIVEETRDERGAPRHQVTRFEPEDLDLIPRVVRDKLDRVGIKLHLKDWQSLSLDERRRLVDMPCAAPGEIERYGRDLERLVRERTGRPPDRLA
jgi:hypothetical protein